MDKNDRSEILSWFSIAFAVSTLIFALSALIIVAVT